MSELLNHTNMMYGVDDDLVDGQVYLPKHALAKFHPYYPENVWQESTIHVNSKVFKHPQVKYNIEIDRLIINVKRNDGALIPIYLNNLSVDSIELTNNNILINRRLITDDNSYKNYFERINNGKISLLLTHNISFKAEFTQSTPYGKYSKRNRKSYLFEDGRLIDVSTKKLFLSFFANIKTELKKYLKDNRIKYKQANNSELKGLMDHCNTLYKK